MKIEEVIKQLESILAHVCSMAASPDADDIWKEDIDALEFAITALRSMQETTKPGWISVKERLPKDFDQALVYDGDKHYPIGICHKGESGIWHSDMAYGMGTITHWMPLPEPPEEGSE